MEISRGQVPGLVHEMKVKREFKIPRYSDLVISERNDVSVTAEMGKYVLAHFVYRHLHTILVL